MMDRYDDDLERDNERRDEERRGGEARGEQRGGAGAGADETEEMERKLRRTGKDDLMGQMEEDRNLTGSTTWETLPDQADQHGQHARKGQAESPNDLTHEEQPKQQKRGGRG